MLGYLKQPAALDPSPRLCPSALPRWSPKRIREVTRALVTRKLFSTLLVIGTTTYNPCRASNKI